MNTVISVPDLEMMLDRPAQFGGLGRYVDRYLPRNTGQVRRRRDFRVYLPRGYDGSRALPLLMVLHGCRQDHLDMQRITGFDRIADREQFIVVYPFVTSHSAMRTQNCWGWWLPHQRVRNRGEVGDLMQIVTNVGAEFAVDRTRMHICGLSAGAAMSIVALATYSDIWKSGASVAGVAYGEGARSVQISSAIPVHYKPMHLLQRQLDKVLVSDAPDLLVLQSTADTRVHLQASVNLVQTWKHACGLRERADLYTLGTTRGKAWRYEEYRDDDKRTRLAYCVVEGVEHSWIGGCPGPFSTPAAPNTSELIWSFLARSAEAEQRSDAHRQAASSAPSWSISSA